MKQTYGEARKEVVEAWEEFKRVLLREALKKPLLSIGYLAILVWIIFYL